MRHYWGTSPIGSRRTKPPINTPDAGVTGAGWSGGHGRASRSTTPSLPPLVWRSHGRPGPTVPRKPAAPQVPTRRSNGGRAERRPTQQREGAPVTGHNTRYGARHPLRGTTPVTRHHTRYEAPHPLRGTTPVTGHHTPHEAPHPARGTTPVTRHYTRYGALHPLRSDAPDQKGCTAYGSGAVPPITRTNAESARRRPTQRDGRCTRYEPLHPLRSATPVTERDTRSEEVHCLRIGCAPNHKNKRGICEMTTDTHQAPGARSV